MLENWCWEVGYDENKISADHLTLLVKKLGSTFPLLTVSRVCNPVAIISAQAVLQIEDEISKTDGPFLREHMITFS